ncbi:MAG TPA: RluA family pseudouridine synthase [Aggregicoccus sp.]|nr:RluA family pseudouridine synthase [Aggregicoccus sp.]
MRAAALPELLTYFEPQPGAAELPAQLASPFEPAEPHPLAQRAARALQARLRGGAPEARGLQQRGGGKMFGVLVVSAPDGRVGYLCAFSGMLEGRWWVPGFAPPLFDAAARDAFWPAAEAELDAYGAQHAEWVRAEEEGRQRLGAAPAQERSALAASLAALEARRTQLEQLRAERSRQLWRQLARTYVFSNARGEQRTLDALFPAEAPPGGAGDCAAPKLLGLAYRHGLRPLALAEFWWGAAPLTGERQEGAFYAACARKCGRVLPFMLEGLAPGPAPRPAPPPIGEDQPHPVYEDPWLLVVDKPAGLLCVPGRHAPGRDSALVRLRRRHAQGAALRVVNGLDTDCSGLLLLARDAQTHALLQRQFARREAEQRFAALLEGHVEGEAGGIALPLRSDPADRARQCVDAQHSQRALTDWQVTRRTGAHTRVALISRTHRPHQLRLHAAHPRGLAAPIVGDRLYGRAGPRLLLHAEALTLVHPHTGQRLVLQSPAPF